MTKFLLSLLVLSIPLLAFADADTCKMVKEDSSFEADPGTFSAPALLEDGSIGVGSIDGHLYVLGDTGESKSDTFVTASIFAPPVELGDGRIAIGTDDGKLSVFGRDGKKSFEFKTNDGIYGSPIQLQNGMIVVGSYDQNAYFIQADGTKKFILNTLGPVIASPLELSDGSVAILSTDRNIYFRHPDGSSKNIFKGSGHFFADPVLLSDGTLVAADDAGKVYFMTENGHLNKTVDLKTPIYVNLGQLADDTVALSGEDGKVYFISPKGQKAVFDTQSKILSAPVAIDTKTVVVADHEGEVFFVSEDGVERGIFHIEGAPGPTIQSQPSNPIVTDDERGALDSNGLAPADEYFGQSKMSILGIHSALFTFNQLLTQDPANAAKIWSELRWTEDAVDDWENKYPQDPWLAREIFNLARAYLKVGTPEAFLRSTVKSTWVSARYSYTWYGRAAQSKLSSEKVRGDRTSNPVSIGGSRVAVGSHDGKVYFLQLTDELFPCE